ncbi:hypothetical protein ACFLV8_01745 [Chloroflexota bacterium]
MVRLEGRVMLVGRPAPVALHPGDWIHNRIRIEGNANRGAMMGTTLKLLEYKRVNVKPLISEVIPLEDAQRAFDSLFSGENTCVLLEP